MSVIPFAAIALVFVFLFVCMMFPPLWRYLPPRLWPRMNPLKKFFTREK